MLVVDGEVFKFPKDWKYALKPDARLWTFFDADCTSEYDVRTFLYPGSPLVVFFTTSPTQHTSDWNKIYRIATANRVVMNPWTKNEIVEA